MHFQATVTLSRKIGCKYLPDNFVVMMVWHLLWHGVPHMYTHILCMCVCVYIPVCVCVCVRVRVHVSVCKESENQKLGHDLRVYLLVS